jgi:hypothetical protein
VSKVLARKWQNLDDVMIDATLCFGTYTVKVYRYNRSMPLQRETLGLPIKLV